MSNPNTSLAKSAPQQKPSALRAMAARLQVDETKMLDTLKGTVFAKANNEEMLALVVVANEYGLNPFLKELYAFPAKGGGICPIVSVDGWNKMLLRQESFDGIEFEFQDDNEGKPLTCTATVYVKNRSKPVKVTEYFHECYRNTDPWNNMPHRMLRNRTLCQAARMAFGFAGVYDPDEAIDIVATELPAAPLRAIRPASPENGTQPSPPPSATARTPQQELETVVIEGGFTFDQFRQWAEATGQLENAASLGSFEELKKADAERLLRAKGGLLTGLKGAAQ
jgi:phage recombination protein Bet